MKKAKKNKASNVFAKETKISEIEKTSPIVNFQQKKPTVFQRQNKTAQIQITLQSPEDQLKQFVRILPNGSIIGNITNSKTLNYKTLKPEPGGLFCEKIFGPVTSNICACGKTRPNPKVTYCKTCEVEYISSRARRYRIGFIELAMPMAHIWYLKGRPSYISLLLDIKQKEAEKLVYGEYWIFRSFTLDFEKRIRSLRNDLNEQAYRFNQRAYYLKDYSPYEKNLTKTQYSSNQYESQNLLPLNLRRKKRTFGQISKDGALDFWVNLAYNPNDPTASQNKYRNPYQDSLKLKKTYTGTKNNYFESSKLFYRIPLIRSSLIGQYDKEYEYKRDKITDQLIVHYLFPQPRKFGILAKPKYEKGLKNSMIYYKNFEFNCFITGGDAFRHLFSQIDCFRMYSLIFYKLLETKKKLRSIELNRDNDQIQNQYLSREHTSQQISPEFIELLLLDKELKKDEKEEKKEIDWYQHHINLLPKLSRKLKLYKTFWRTGTRPEWMFISFLPIIPPDLRPILKLNKNQLAVSDLNRLYQYVFLRNKNLKEVKFNIYKRALNLDFSMKNGIQVSRIDYECDFQTYKFTLALLSFHTNQVQRALDALFENNKGGSQAICGFNDRPLKSLSEILKGKTGRFRQNLLGKRVDYSGRSVIVVGPTLKLHECGLPKEIALELFQPLLIRKMIFLNLSKTIIGAKKLIHQDHPIIWHILNEVMSHYPILLNRAPTLHRLGVQAFLPRLVRGKAILLHPLVCPAFNADFDGDQMGVHLPISLEAKSEAWSLMLATQNILSPATGEPILVPSQDMVLGCYYSTTINLKTKYKKSGSPYFNSIEDAYKTYLAKNLHPHMFIWLKWNDNFESNQPKRRIIEIRLKRYKNKFAESTFIAPNVHQTFQSQKWDSEPILLTGILKNQYIKTTMGRILINKLFQENILNFKRKYINYFTRTETNLIKIEPQKLPTESDRTIPPYYGYLVSNRIEKNFKPNPLN